MKRINHVVYSFILFMFISTFLSGCGIVNAIQNGIFNAALIINILAAVLALVSLVQRYLSAINGTNAVTKFIRFGGNNMLIKRTVLLCVFATIFCTLIGFGAKGLLGLLAGLPTLLAALLGFFFQVKISKNKERVEAARTVTKGTLKATAAVAQTAGTAIGTAVGGPAGTAIGSSIGNAVGSIADQAAGNMTDVKANVDYSAANAAIQQAMDPALFMKKASGLGISTDGKQLGQIAHEVVKYAPDASMKEIDSKLDEVSKALLILNAKVDKVEESARSKEDVTVVEVPKIVEVSKEDKKSNVIEGTFRELPDKKTATE